MTLSSKAGLAASLVGVLFAGGCAPQGSRLAAPLAEGALGPACVSDDDCDSGLSCESLLGACVLPDARPVVAAVQVLPPNDSPWAPAQRLVEAGGTPSSWAISLAPVAEVGGVVRTLGDPLGAAVPAAVVARAPGIIEATSLRAEARSSEALDGAGHSFSLRLAPQVPYVIRIFPDDEERPAEAFVRAFPAGPSTLDVTLPAKEGPSAYPRIVGRIVADGASGRAGAPVGGVRVVAVGVEDGDDEPTGVPLVSTPAVTDSKFGRFELRVPARPAHYTLIVDNDPGHDGVGLVLHSEVDLASRGVSLQGRLGEVVDVGDVAVAVWPASKLSVAATAPGPGGAPAPVGSAEVTVSLHDLGVVVQTGTTDAKGHWQGTIPIVDGALYDVRVVPPAGSAAGATSVGWTPGDATPVRVNCPPRALVRAHIHLPSGEPAAGATLDASLHANDRPPIQALADAGGIAQVYLDPGAWEFVARPPPGVGAAPAVAMRTVSNGEVVDLPLQLEPAAAVRGVVTGADGQPVASATVEVFAPGLAPGEPPVPIASTQTNAQGWFAVPAPATWPPASP